ncbi:unnamed protein product, partial [Rotaria sp. Silwood1]
MEGAKQTGGIKSLETYRNISNNVKHNVGIHRNDVNIVHEKIKSIEILDPNDPMVKNEFLRYFSNNKLRIGMIALLITIDITTIVLLVIKDDYRIETSTTVTISNLVGSLVGDILGGIIFGFVGTKIGQLLVGLSLDIACGQGPPEPDYLQFIYGDNKNFSIPLPKLVIANEIPSDFIKCVGWRGGSSTFARAVFKALNINDRHV